MCLATVCLISRKRSVSLHSARFKALVSRVLRPISGLQRVGGDVSEVVKNEIRISRTVPANKALAPEFQETTMQLSSPPGGRLSLVRWWVSLSLSPFFSSRDSAAAATSDCHSDRSQDWRAAMEQICETDGLLIAGKGIDRLEVMPDNGRACIVGQEAEAGREGVAFVAGVGVYRVAGSTA